MKLIISCEHATNRIPPDYQYLFKQAEHELLTHRAIDFGAEHLAQALGDAFKSPCIFAKTSRLLIDYNRSLKNKHCFSKYTSALDVINKKYLIDRYYTPYRQAVEALVHAYTQQKHRVLHLSVHSFTPILDGMTRHADFGLLYDPSRTHEKAFAYAWKKHLSRDDAPYRVRMNYPYRGTSDGFTSALRKQYDNDQYIGIELEVNQNLIFTHNQFCADIINTVIHSLKTSTRCC